MPASTVSVALPVKNGLPHLRNAIEGLCRQTYPHIELLIQDSVSTDGSLEYLRSLKTPFPIHIVSERDGSLVAGYSRALRRCNGDLVVTAACDEVLDDDAIERYVAWHEKMPEAVFIYSGVRLMRDGRLSEYQPQSFDLIDYLRHRMCTTTAGVFNRRLIGAELRLDESLKTVPDFELMTRLALRFGPQRLVCRQGMTVTARADEASATFRPESYRQIARDKTTIVNRLFAGGMMGRLGARGMAQEFQDFFRRDILCGMHVSFAYQIHSIAGDCEEYREQVIAANGYQPADPSIEGLALGSRYFEFDRHTRKLSVRTRIPPLYSPAESVVVASLPAHAIRVEAPWAEVGARQEPAGDAHLVTTSALPWSYAACLPLELGGLAFGRDWHWIRLSLTCAEGQPMVSLFNSRTNSIAKELGLTPGDGPTEIVLELRDDGFDTVMLRNGPLAQAATVAFHSAEIVSMPMLANRAA